MLDHALVAPGSLSRSLAALAFGALAAGGLWLSLDARAAATRVPIGVVFDGDACALSPGIAAMIGGPVSPAECRQVETLARYEIAAAFEGLRVDITQDPRAFWTVRVVGVVPAYTRLRGASGASVALGPFGGRGLVGLSSIVGHALRHAPTGVSRQQLLDAIGRGVGRSVVHELAHQVAGGAIDDDDPATYEYFSADRVEQYYGTLRWGSGRARVHARLSD